MVKWCREVLWGSVVEMVVKECCGEVMWLSVAWLSVVVACCIELLGRSVVVKEC